MCMHKNMVSLPVWVQTDLYNQLIGEETIQSVSILSNYPLNIKNSYLAVTDRRLIGTQKTWFSTRRVDVPLRDITRVQVNMTIKIGKIIKTVLWAFLSSFLFVLIIPVILMISNFLSILEKDLEWTVKGYGSEVIGGQRKALELAQRTIRESQHTFQT
jgi:hypothetical protein